MFGRNSNWGWGKKGVIERGEEGPSVPQKCITVILNVLHGIINSVSNHLGHRGRSIGRVSLSAISPSRVLGRIGTVEWRILRVVGLVVARLGE